MEGSIFMNNLDVLYEDNHIIVVLKPANILSQADNTNDIDMLNIVKEYVKCKYNKPGNVYIGLIHRLDRPVGGVMVFARTSKAASRLSLAIKNHMVKKSYLAVVHGKVKNEDTLVDYLLRLENGDTIVSNKVKGKEAELSYKLLCYDDINDMSLVEIKLKTGRHHQIRVQFASRNHPLVGDMRYGKKKSRSDGLALFAYKLEFIHPVTKKNLYFFKLPLISANGFNLFNMSSLVKE
ncbi:MAG: RluA family pseudouridine synthase [Bacilli bacterium]|nr:RluA family pseudouridine synthase [Bacilli bacterium]